MTDIDEHGRPQPPLDGDETTTALGFLDYQRATFAWKCRGVDRAGLSLTVANSTMTLGGMLRHLALVEEYWFSRWLWESSWSAGWKEVDENGEPDWNWQIAERESVEELWSRWEAACERSRENVARALTGADLGRRAAHAEPSWGSPTLRWIVLHMLEEYARHNGHADLLREAIDGETGE